MVTYATYVTNVRKDVLFNDTAIYILFAEKPFVSAKEWILMEWKDFNDYATANICLSATVEIKLYERAKIYINSFMEVSDLYNFSSVKI